MECRTLGLTFTDSLLINAYLCGISFRRMTLRNLDFSDADLGGVDFRDSVFENCSLRNANLKGARFQGTDLRGADLGGLRLSDAGLFRRMFHTALDKGVYLPPSPYETCFISTAHDNDSLDQTIGILSASLAAL